MKKRQLLYLLLLGPIFYNFFSWKFFQIDTEQLEIRKLYTNSIYFKFDSHDYPIKAKNCTRIDKSETLFFIGLSSSPTNFAFREAIRQTWMADANYESKTSKLKAVIRFFVGRSSDVYINELLKVEGNMYGDLVQGDFHDTYRNMTLKTVSMFEYALKFCSQASFYFKSDDDCWVNIPKLIEKYAAKKDEEVFAGELRKHAKPTREVYDRWYVSREEYEKDVFPDYVSGGGYLLSKPALIKVFGFCRLYKVVSMEDIRMGICADLVNVTRTNEDAISTNETDFTGCKLSSMIVMHPLHPDNLTAVWPEIKALRNRKSICVGNKSVSN